MKYIVIIPAYCEPDMFLTLDALCQCDSPDYEVEVFLLINYSEDCSSEIKIQNEDLYNSLLAWAEEKSDQLKLIPLIAKDLPVKHAGVGLARKILMDTACRRFNDIGISDGLIISLDADTIVPKNYFTGIEKHLNQSPDVDCLLFNFEHPMKGNAYSDTIYSAIVLYELYLRYYKQILNSIGFPYSHYTIGSCFAVKAKMYVKVGGMSRRKAGEDFYFLHKVFPNANTYFLEGIILTPSPRPSSRVPFGTGPTIQRISNEITGVYETYHPQSFIELEDFLKIIPKLYSLSLEKCRIELAKLPVAIKTFLFDNDVLTRIEEVNNNCTTEYAFVKRFYSWFDAFVVLKYLNSARDNYFGSLSVVEAVKYFLKKKNGSAVELLKLLRERDRNKLIENL